MDYQLKREGNEASFKITITPEEFTKMRSVSYNKRAGKISVPGFRKGKVPQAMAENYFGAEAFFDDAINDALPELFEAAEKELKLKTVDRPNIDCDEMTVEKGAVLSIKVTCQPEIELKEYKGIEVPEIKVEVSDKEIDETLEYMQKRNSRIISSPDKVLENGDIAVINFEGFIDEVAFEGGKGESYPLELGSGSFIPGFEEQLSGKKLNDEVDVKVVFPKEYHASDLAGKEAVFKVKVVEVQSRDLPKLDDEFAKDVSEFNTLDELKADIKAKKLEEAENNKRIEMEDSILDVIMETLKVDVPEIMVNAQLQKIAHNLEHSLSHQGLTLEQYFSMTGTTFDNFREQYETKALSQVKASLIIEKVADLENISKEEENYPIKVLDFLIENAKIVKTKTKK